MLGPLEVVEQGDVVALGQGKERSLLALLLLHANEVVSTDRLIDELWPGEPPAKAAKAVQVYVSRLRKRLGEQVISTRSPGYVIELDPEQLDALYFERLVAHARVLPAADAALALREALGLFRGPPLADFAYEPFAQSEIARLGELRLAAVEERIDAELALGRHAELIAELEALVRSHPLRERLRAQLMLALYRSGRQSDALQAYRDARRTLADEQGLEPGEELKDLERRILRHDPGLDVTSASADPDGPVRRSGARVLLSAAALAALGMAGAAVVASRIGNDSAGLASVPPNSVALIDPGTNAVVAAIPVGERPTRIAAYGDSLWILHPDGRTLSRVSRSERKVTGTAGLGTAPAGIAADRHGVWVSDARAATVMLVDPERLTVKRTIRARSTPLRLPYSDAGSLAIGYGSLWFASGERTISRIDPDKGVVRFAIRDVMTGGPGLGGIVAGAGAVWVAGLHAVTRISPASNSVVAEIELALFRATGLAVSQNAVWVSDVGSDQVFLIDPGRSLAAGATKVGGQPLSVARGAGSLWVANSGDGTVSRIDPTSGRVTATITVGGSPNGIAVTDGEVWVTVD